MAVWMIEIEGQTFEVDVQSLEAGRATVVVDGQSYDVGWDEPEGQIAPVSSVAGLPSPTPTAPVAAPASRGPALEGAVASPLPGMVLDVLVAVGDSVEKGQVVVKLEAMKMANEVRCGLAGTVAAVLVRKGDTVDQGAPLLRIG